MAISSELRFLSECCRLSFAGGYEASVSQAQQLDWAQVLRLARFHRVQGLVANALPMVPGGLPKEIAGEILNDAKAIAAAHLTSAAESQRLLTDFTAAGVPLLFIKGLTLGALAYRKPPLKSSIDIDLLIDPADLDRAARLLRSNGYALHIPNKADSDKLERWHRRSKESVWIKSAPVVQIDLHTRTADSPRLIPEINVRSPRQPVDMGSAIRLPTLANEELFAYLAVHGASSAWFRLKWIADFAGLISGRSPDELKQLYWRSQQLSAGRAAGQALLLADALFGTLRSASTLREELIHDSATHRLYLAALRLLSGEAREPTERPLGTMTMHWTQFLLLPGLNYKLSELSRQVRNAGKRFS
jgi:hypothetical protein